ncbi:MAG: glycoside hydrolase family 2 protein, partial [Candidatus Firestonebacteria bacterium]|nr:glycoside hydrolase family 2 protein [Candidatus Firestonebacteria bacterium]
MRSLDLNGEWELVQPGRNLKISATVPGQVQLDLLRAGVIPDPYVGAAEDTQNWVADEIWEYSRDFTPDDALLAKQQVCLVCEGLDTVAEIFVNGTSVGRTQNQFRTYSFSIKPFLKSGKNSLRIVFKPAAAYAAQQAVSQPLALPYVDYTGRNEHRNFIRKCQADFGWDWGPALRPVGIWRSLRLEAWNEARIDAVVCGQTHEPNGDVLLNLRVWLDSPLGARGRLEARLGRRQTQQTVALAVGENRVEINWRIENPRRWWPRGYGEQVLYPLSVVFIGEGGEI